MNPETINMTTYKNKVQVFVIKFKEIKNVQKEAHLKKKQYFKSLQFKHHVTSGKKSINGNNMRLKGIITSNKVTSVCTEEYHFVFKVRQSP